MIPWCYMLCLYIEISFYWKGCLKIEERRPKKTSTASSSTKPPLLLRIHCIDFEAYFVSTTLVVQSWRPVAWLRLTEPIDLVQSVLLYDSGGSKVLSHRSNLAISKRFDCFTLIAANAFSLPLPKENPARRPFALKVKVSFLNFIELRHRPYMVRLSVPLWMDKEKGRQNLARQLVGSSGRAGVKKLI